MRAIRFDGALRLADDLEIPTPAPGEARIRTVLAGICNTDLEIVRGYASFAGVLGHEFVGLVDSAADPALIGQRVVGEINAACGRCPTCASGRPTHCPSRTALGIRGRDGALAEYFCLPTRNLHRVPVNVPNEAAVFTEPLAAACQVVEQVHVRPSDRALVLGDGKLGLLVAQVLALAGVELAVVGRHPDRLELLSRRAIRTLSILEAEANPEALTADLVVECTGNPSGFHTARRLVRPGGTLVLKSTYHGQAQVDLSSLVVDEVRLVGSRCGPFPAALRLLERGLVDVGPLVAAEYPLARGLEAFDHAARRGALKVLVRP